MCVSPEVFGVIVFVDNEAKVFVVELDVAFNGTTDVVVDMLRVAVGIFPKTIDIAHRVSLRGQINAGYGDLERVEIF